MAAIGTNINKAIQLLKEGKLVAIPTETVYGLAANALNPEAVAGIFKAKQRPHFDPLIVHLYDKKSLAKVVDHIPTLFDKLYEAFSPGPITYILPRSEAVPDIVTSGNPTVGIRFPNHPLTRELLFESGLALAAPSANPFGYVSPTTAQHVNDQLGNTIPYILDGGPSTVGIESTIIDLSEDETRILRLGGLAVEDIFEITGPIEVRNSSSNPKAPGMLSSHYAPAKKVILGDLNELIPQYREHKVGIITFSEEPQNIEPGFVRILSPAGNLCEAAARLFKALRDLDKEDVDFILAEKFPEEGLGRAINDRLKRASFNV